jgi:hypothetical protein
MFIIENKEMLKGGAITWNGTYRLKHVSSGNYLCLKIKRVIVF